MLSRLSLLFQSGQAVMLQDHKSLEKNNSRQDIGSAHSFPTTILIVLIGLLLGRAMILFQLLPFVVPYIAVIFVWRKSYILAAALSLIAGSTTISFQYAGQTFIAIILYFFIRKLFYLARKEEKLIPLIVFLSIFAARYVSFFIQGNNASYSLLSSLIEAGLGMIITLIFFQSIPLVLEGKRKVSLKHEEIICLIILLASLMTGTVGWLIFQLSIEQVIARYVVLTFAFVGGAAIGSTVGVVTGLILSLANVANLFYMSLLAFSGLLGGLLKEGKKLSVSLGLLISTFLIGMYGDNQVSMEYSLYESLFAIGLFFMTPKTWLAELGRFIPGTAEHSQEQQQYVRKIRDVTAGKVEQFSDLFMSLSNSFTLVDTSSDKSNREREVDLFLSRVTEETCQTCMKKQQCWTKNFDKTYGLMESMMKECEEKGDVKNSKLIGDWKQHCIKNDRVIQAIKNGMSEHFKNRQLKEQLQESRKLVAVQLEGISKVMEDLAKEIQRERKAHEKQESDIIEALQQSGIEVDSVDVYHLEEGNVDIDMILPTNRFNEGEKIVAPLLSSILNEPIIVKHIEALSSYGEERKITFGSTKTFIVEDGIVHAAKDGRLISGDSYSTMDLGGGKYAIAISDGMGNGERAHMESQETINLLKNILRSGIEETIAIKSINSILSLRSQDEVFSTLDLAMIDLQDGLVKFLKVGSTPSYIKRGKDIVAIEAANLPIGIINEVSVDVVTEQLKAGDLLIMMSDGIYEAPIKVENKDMWLKRMIREIETKDPQEVADILMERVVRESDNQIHDDMTIIVAKIDHHLPKWATINLPSKKQAQ